jgi:hypothetical protein
MVATTMPLAAQGERSQVIVRATSTDGQPVLDLQPADLTLRIDGRDRSIVSLQLVRPVRARDADPKAPAQSLPAPYTTNAAGDTVAKGAREFVIAIDDEGIAPGREQPVRTAVSALLDSLGPGDAVGLAGLKSGGMRFAPTTDHAAVREALGRIVALGTVNESANDLGCRTKTVLHGIGGLLQDASAARTVVVFSAGVGTPTGETIRANLGKEADAMAAICQVYQRDLDELGRIAHSSPAALSVVFVPEALGHSTNRGTVEAGLENVAGVAGGAFIRMAGTDATVTRIAQTAGIYYVAQIDGISSGARRIDARVAREGIKVAARPGSPPAAAGAAPATVKEMMTTSATFSTLALRSSGFVSRQPGSQDLKVTVLFEPTVPGTKLSAGVVGLYDQKGTLKAQWSAQGSELTRSPILAALTILPGEYRMRVAATTADGKAGTTDTEISAQLADIGPLKAGQMLVGGNPASFSPKLEFTSQDAALVGVFEVYGVTADHKVEVTFELAKDTTGPSLGSTRGTVGKGPGPDARLVFGGFGLAPLEPGDYVLRAAVSVDGAQVGRILRTIRKVK